MSFAIWKYKTCISTHNGIPYDFNRNRKKRYREWCCNQAKTCDSAVINKQNGKIKVCSIVESVDSLE